MTYVTSEAGVIAEHDEVDNSSAKGDPRELRYYFNGVQLGMIGNNGTDDVDNTTIINRRVARTRIELSA